VSPYEEILAEWREVRKALDRIADKLTLIAPRGTPVTEWSCGHGHVTRDEAVACLQEQRREKWAAERDHAPFPAG
jgi:hypothetical protein